MYNRILEKKIENEFFSWKIIMLLGARQVGKTTLMENILWSRYKNSEILSLNGDYNEDKEVLSSGDMKKLDLYVEDKKIIFVDEAQKIENIWNTLKILIDKYKNRKQILVTGSSSINLLDLTSEPLTGRKIVHIMYPISCEEIKKTYDIRYLDQNLNTLLVYGSYPEVLNVRTISDKIKILKELSNSSLYRDILEFQQIRNSFVLMKLLKLLALQIWKEVSINELATNLGIDTKTVNKYIDLLEKSFIIFSLAPYFTNKRKELNKSKKIYFYDLWIRNAVINDFNDIENRRDVWDLWENFLIIERMKYNSYYDNFLSSYFWKNYNQQEIDYIEDYNSKLYAYEIKWGKKKVKLPQSFAKTYQNANFELVNKQNYLNFVLGRDI